MMRRTIKKLGRPTVATLAYLTGYCHLAEVIGAGQGARIISYHGIEDNPANPYAVSIKDLALEMRFLAENFSLFSVDQLALLIRNRMPIPPKGVAVTFDDGYSDVFKCAYPILKQFGIPATIFLPIAFIGSSSQGRETGRLAQNDFLTWAQVREMRTNGISFGSHTMNHMSLTTLTPRQVRSELKDSKARLENELGERVTGLAYPYGTVRDVNRQIEHLVAAAGYDWAVTGTSGVNNHRSDVFALRRTKVERDDGMYVFEKAMRGALDPWVVADRLGGLLRSGPTIAHEGTD